MERLTVLVDFRFVESFYSHIHDKNNASFQKVFLMLILLTLIICICICFFLHRNLQLMPIINYFLRAMIQSLRLVIVTITQDKHICNRVTQNNIQHSVPFH